MGMTVSGLGGGLAGSLDVPTIVSQLIQSESIPQLMLQNQLTAVQTDATTYRGINSSFQSLLSAAQAMTSSATWTTTTATSSSPSSVAVASTGTAQAGAVTFDVKQTAVAQSMISTNATPWSSTSDPYGGTLPLSVYDANNNLLDTVNPTGTGSGGAVTLGDVVNAINGNSKLGLSATAIQVAPGKYQLGLTAKGSGTANAFTLSDTTNFKKAASAADATLWVGDATNGYAVTSSTNTFTGLMPGVTLTVAGPATGVTVSVASDPQSVGDKMKALVTAANSVLSQISSATATSVGADGKATTNGGALPGDYTMQNLASQVRRAVSAAVGTLGSPVQAGVELNSDGTIKFTEDTFVSALKANPGLVSQLVNTGQAATTTTDPNTGLTTTVPAAPGLAAQLVTLAKAASDSVTGTLVGLANGQDAQAKRLQSQIDSWTDRLADRRQQLTTQYSSLQAMLSTLQNQSTWLTGMLGAFTGSSSSSKSS